MKIAYEYSIPSIEQLSMLGLDLSALPTESGLAVTAFDGDEPIGFGYVRPSAERGNDYCIQVNPAYSERQIDANIRKLLRARSPKSNNMPLVCI